MIRQAKALNTKFDQGEFTTQEAYQLLQNLEVRLSNNFNDQDNED